MQLHCQLQALFIINLASFDMFLKINLLIPPQKYILELRIPS